MFRKFFYILLITISFTARLTADDTYPYSYNVAEKQTGGKLIITNPESNTNNHISFFLKPNWIEESNVLYVWNGFIRNDAKGNALSGTVLIDAIAYENYLLALIRDREKIIIGLLDSNAELVSDFYIPGEWEIEEEINAEWIARSADNRFFLNLNGHLYICDLKDNSINAVFIQKDVEAAVFIEHEKYDFAYLVVIEGNGILHIVDSEGKDRELARMAVSDLVKLFSCGNTISLLVSSDNFFHSWVNFIDVDKGFIKVEQIKAAADIIHIRENKDGLSIAYLKNDGRNYQLIFDEYSGAELSISMNNGLPEGFIEPIGLWYIDKSYLILFRNGIVTTNKYGQINSVDFLPVGELFDDKPEVNVFENYLLLTTDVSSIILKKEDHPFWFVSRFISDTGRFILPIILIFTLLILYNFYSRQKRLLGAVLNLPSSGAVIVLDQIGRLYEANPSGKKLMGISEGLPMKKQFQHYFTAETSKPVKDLLEESMANKSTIKKKLNIMRDGDDAEWYCTVVPLRTITGQFKGLVFTGIDITEELERKRLSNWAQLAHDMQTNLTTIRLNAEQLAFEDNNGNAGRKKKILHQVNLLIQRIRDVVTVGRSDSINKTIEDGEQMCFELRNEFDDAIFPYVEFILNTKRGKVFCDKTKLIRALRNAVENGIRSMDDARGTIIISNWKDARFAYFSIKDNGTGMDEKTKSNMLKPYFSTSKKYGGSGMGTMIMQHVVEQHGGEITINTEKGHGTEIIFTIPNFIKKS